MGFFGSLGQGLSNVANVAVKASPYALQAVRQKQAEDEADRQRMLVQMYQQNQDRRAEMASTGAYALNAANIMHTNASTDALRNPQTSVQYIPDAQGNLVAMPKKIGGAPSTSGMPSPSVTPSGADASQGPQGPQGPQVPSGIKPIATGVKVAPKPTPPPPRIDPNSPAGIAADSTKAANRAALRPPPKAPPSEPLVQVKQPDGSTKYVPRSQAAGQSPPSKDAMLSGQTMQTLGRLGMSFNDLSQALDQMDRFENDPKNLQRLTAGKQAMGALSQMHPATDVGGLFSGINNAAGSYLGAKAQQALGKGDPDYTTYLNNRTRVATAFTELLPRPNQQLLQLEKGLSGQDVNWNPTLIKNIQSRRRGGLDVLKNILAQQGMLNESGEMTGRAPGKASRAAPSGNIDLTKAPPTKAPATTGRDYGIFGKPPSGEEE